MTANDDEATRNEAMDAGCIAYLRKPFARQVPAGCYWESCGLTGAAQTRARRVITSELGQSHRFGGPRMTSGLPPGTDVLRGRSGMSQTCQQPTSAWMGILICEPLYNGTAVGLQAMVQKPPVRIERRLSAILAADVAGYSRLMHHDEEATHAKLTGLLAESCHARHCRTRRPHSEEHWRRVLGGVSKRGRSGPRCCAVPDPHS